jgi:hypothetical protein
MSITQREARALAYRLADEIETRAQALMARNPACRDMGQAVAIVIQAMAMESRGND